MRAGEVRDTEKAEMRRGEVREGRVEGEESGRTDTGEIVGAGELWRATRLT